MNQPSAASAKAHLGSLISRVMEDGKVDEAERNELLAFFANALLSVSDVKDVFSKYLKALQDEVLADGIVTATEKQKCKAVVDQLKIPLRFLSPELLAIVVERPQS